MYLQGKDRVERFRTAREFIQKAQASGIKKLREMAMEWHKDLDCGDWPKEKIISELRDRLHRDAV